ncbi:MAG: alpha/beta fold hydrolase, partial [Robiginitomaculum sp.]|nr:alpha/beta fold hydrolase [Robiginitomaculum sp.]
MEPIPSVVRPPADVFINDFTENMPLLEEPDQTDSKLTACQQDGMRKRTGEPAQYRLFDCVTVFYGTNREQQDNLQNPYGRSPIAANLDIKLGKLVVAVPSKHLPGAKIKKLRQRIQNPTREDRSGAFTLWDWSEDDELTREMFQQLANNKLKTSGPYENQAFVFIHGYNTIFRNAVFRTAQIKADIEFDGPVFLYSWPSNGIISQYFSDQDDADLSARRLVDYLQTIKAGLHADTKIHVIAHSMGNRIFAQAL